MFCVPSPAVAPEPSLVPIRFFARPKRGIRRTAEIASPTPTQLALASLPVIRRRVASTTMYGARRKKLIATTFRAIASASSEWMRSPVNRQMITRLATPSIVLSIPQPINAIEPAATPAMTPTTASVVIQARLSHEMSLTCRTSAAWVSPSSAKLVLTERS
jgi:hypothetical protein